jgi:hypothetical protein
MTAPDEIQLAEPRIQWAGDDDVERTGRRGRARSESRDSLSIRSISRRRIVEPNVALPIQFRTLCASCYTSVCSV